MGEEGIGLGLSGGRAGRSRVVLLASVLVLSACAPGLRSGADFDPAVQLAAPLTFAWDAPDTLPSDDLRLEGNPIVDERVREAIERELNARGIRYSEASPDLLVHFHGAVRDRVQVVENDRARGYQTSQYGDDVEVFQYEEGTLVVDVANADTRKVIWRGWAVADVGSALNDQAELTELVNRGVNSMFGHFPLQSSEAADDR